MSDHMGYSLLTDHAHCAFPDQQRGDLDVSVRPSLLGEDVNITVNKNYAGTEFEKERWADWDMPTLR